MRYWIALLVVFLCCPEVAWAMSAKLINLRLSQTGSKIQVTLTLDSKVSNYKVFALANPNRIVIDLPNTQLMVKLEQLQLGTMPINSFRSGHPTADTLRLVLDVKKFFQPSAMLNSNKNGDQLIISLQENAAAISQSVPAKQVENAVSQAQPSPRISAAEAEKFLGSENYPQAVSSPASSAQSATAIVQSRKGKRDVVVVIDPGHGGKDPGAMGISGTSEKNIVLAIARQLQARLNQSPGIHAVLTRKADYYIGLRERLNIARRDHADMFIAVHADAFNNPDSMGSSVFALSVRGATSEAARWIAEKENYSELGGVNLDDKSDLLRSVLIDLSQTATISSSLQLGSMVLQQLGRVSRLHHGKVEQARFVVLKSPDIPSLLVETGFLSNPLEEHRLQNPFYQQEIATAIEGGILRYFRRNPPTGSVFAER